MRNIAILGFGVVGSGVYEVLKSCPNPPLSGLNIKYILDLRSFPGHPLADRVTPDFDSIIADESVEVVVETMGGIDPAYGFCLRALKAGKSVVTSNKAVVDAHGEELERAALENGVCYLYEASVGGGIPIIGPMRSCFAADRITRVSGILNGTTNYILTHMRGDGISMEEALDTARRLGYAERDPHADLAGIDTARKLAILSGIAFNRYITYRDIPIIEGIEDVTLEDIRLAEQAGCLIKLMAVAELNSEGVAKLAVAPFLLGWHSFFHAVHDAQNAISVVGSAVGETVFCGSGAGSLPTAAAVCGDVARALSAPAVKGAPHPACASLRKPCEPGFILPAGENDFRRVTLPNGKSYRILA